LRALGEVAVKGRIGLGCADYGLGLFQGAALLARGLGGLVGGLALDSFRQLAGSYWLPSSPRSPGFTLPFLGFRLLQGPQFPRNRDRLGVGEVFAGGVLGVFAEDDAVEVDDGDGDVAAAEGLEGAQTSGPGDQASVWSDHDGVEQADGFDALCEGVDVAVIGAGP
jgi:hypothetical protein